MTAPAVLLFSNNAQGTLAAPINNAVTSLSVGAGQGALFPNPGAGEAFMVTLNDAATGLLTEIMRCTARVGDVLTVVRGQDGTSAEPWTTGDIVSQFMTAGTAAQMQQRNLPEVNINGLTNLDVVLTSAQVAAIVGGAPMTLNGVLTGDVNVEFPDGVTGQFLALNATSGAHAVKIKTVSGSGPFIAQDGLWYGFLSDATNIGALGYLTSAGLPSAASTAETKAGASTTKFVTPAGLLGALGVSGSFKTTAQTLALSTPINIAHGLAAKPEFVTGFLQCNSAELNYNFGDRFYIGGNLGAQSYAAASVDEGIGVAADATNITILPASSQINIRNKTSGVSSSITLAKWDFFATAYSHT